MKPPDDLKDWSKNDLVRELRRLRAVLREHAQQPGDEPVGDGGSIVDVAGDPHARGGVLMDARNAVLMDAVDVSLVDTKGEDEQLVCALLLAGRVNYQDRRATQLYLFDADGAAAIISELTGLAARAGGQFSEDFQARLQTRLAALP
jgi:hypothetical protein